MKKKIAVIGSGIAGLSAAYFLQNQFDVTLFEKNHYLGGHANTQEVKVDLYVNENQHVFQKRIAVVFLIFYSKNLFQISSLNYQILFFSI